MISGVPQLAIVKEIMFISTSVFFMVVCNCMWSWSVVLIDIDFGLPRLRIIGVEKAIRCHYRGRK